MLSRLHSVPVLACRVWHPIFKLNFKVTSWRGVGAKVLVCLDAAAPQSFAACGRPRWLAHCIYGFVLSLSKPACNLIIRGVGATECSVVTTLGCNLECKVVERYLMTHKLEFLTFGRQLPESSERCGVAADEEGTVSLVCIEDATMAKRPPSVTGNHDSLELGKLAIWHERYYDSDRSLQR